MKRFFQGERTNALLTSLSVALILLVSGWASLKGAVDWMVFGLSLVTVLLIPPVARKDPKTMVPWPMAALAALPFVAGVIADPGLFTEMAAYVTAAAIAIIVVVELDAFTAVKMNRGFAITFVVATTMTVAGVWELLRWFWDLTFDTGFVESNDDLMWQLIAATSVGVVAGIGFDRYLGRLPGMDRLPDGLDTEGAEEQFDETGDAVSGVLSRFGFATEDERRLTRLLQGVLVVIALVGFLTLNVDVVVSAGIGITATALPGLFERNYDFQIDPALTLWIAVAVVFHALGTVWLYQTLWGWHNIAHATTGSLVAGIGYTVLRTIEAHTASVSFPPKFTAVFVVIFVFAVGVAWEIFEFTLDQVTAVLVGEEMLLTQHGLQDTMSDLAANTAGALVVAVAATVYRVRSGT